tara:strand:+ start:24842 stop:26077 length:1236 start_codon:yes stop_codon:yes gene_type:complete
MKNQKYLEIKCLEKKIKVKDLLNRATYVDPRFQRKACWKTVQKEKFLNSLVRGYAVNPIINADLHACEEFCSKNDLPLEQRDFQHAIESHNVDFVSVDGQNRTSTLQAYKNNKFTSSSFSTDGKRKLFKKLSEEEQKAFEDTEILVVDIYQATYSQMTEVFRAVNGGMPLNRMELRNALNTPIARFVRSLADKYPFLVERVESVTKTRMKDLDTALKAACFLHSKVMSAELKSGQCDLAFSENGLDQFYEHGIGQGLINIGYYGTTFSADVHKMFEWLDKVIQHAGTDEETGNFNKVTMPFFWALCSVYRLMVVENNLPNLRSFCQSSRDFHAAVYDIVSTAHGDLTRQSHLDYGNKLKKNPKESKANYYCYYSTDVKDSEKRVKVRNELLLKIPESVKNANHWRNTAQVV